MKHQMKVWLLLLALLLTVCCLAACDDAGAGENGGEANGGDTAPPVVVVPDGEPEGFADATQLTGTKICLDYSKSSPFFLYYNETLQKAYVDAEHRSMLLKSGKAFMGLFGSLEDGIMFFDADLNYAVNESMREFWMEKLQKQTSGWDQRLTLYPQFTDAVWEVHFETLGGTGVDGTAYIRYGADMGEQLAAPAKDHATFKGWKNAAGKMVTDALGIPLPGFEYLTIDAYQRSVVLPPENDYDKPKEALVLTAVYENDKVPLTVFDESGGMTQYEYDYGTIISERDFDDDYQYGYSIYYGSRVSFGTLTLTEPTTLYKYDLFGPKQITIHVGNLRTETITITYAGSGSTHYLNIKLTEENYAFGGWFEDAAYTAPVNPYVDYRTAKTDYYVKLIPVTP